LKKQSEARPGDRAPDGFDEQWRERFMEFATLREDDAGIAGWSGTGLDTRFRCFRGLWRRAPAGARYLDAGCGAATYTRWLAEQGVNPIGVDYSLPTLRKARARTPPSIFLCAGDATRLPFRSASFDGILCFGLLQAVSDSAQVADELARVLKPGGELWIDALNRGAVAARIEQGRRRLRGKGMHLRYERAAELVSILTAAGFDSVQRHWLPIVPARFPNVQRALDSRAVRAMLAAVYPLGVMLSHAFILHARRAASVAQDSTLRGT